MSNFKFSIRNQCIFVAIYSAVILLFASAMSKWTHHYYDAVCLFCKCLRSTRKGQHFSAADQMCICTWLNRLDAKAVQSRVSKSR